MSSKEFFKVIFDLFIIFIGCAAVGTGVYFTNPEGAIYVFLGLLNLSLLGYRYLRHIPKRVGDKKPQK